MGSVVITVIFGALLALGTPNRKGMMIAFVFLNQIAMGWGQYLSIAYTQLGVSANFICYFWPGGKVLTFWRLNNRIWGFPVDFPG